MPSHRNSSHPSISACLVVHNEAKVMERALKSIVDIVDEILIIHDGPCSDETIKICKKYTKNIVESSFIGEAEPHRVTLLKKAVGDWILQLDADEFLSQDLRYSLRDLVKDDDVSCYEFIWPYWKGNKYRTRQWPTKKALYRKKDVSFLGFPHEEIRVDGNIKKIKFILEHQPLYDNYSLSTFSTKWKKWIDIHAHYFLCDYRSLSRYPSNSKKLIPHYNEIVANPLLSAVTLPPYHFLGSYLLGGWKEGVAGFTISGMTAMYYLMVCIRVWQLQRDQ